MRVLAKYFNNLEKVISSHYDSTPSSHSSDKGEDREDFLVKLLNNHLPKISVAQRGGEILDCWDRKSGQTDIVVYSAFSPLMGHSNKPMFLAEGTYAAIEVKSVLNHNSLNSSLDWSRKIKKLQKFISPNPKEMGIVGMGDTINKICTGIFAYTSRIKKEKVIEKIFQYNKSGVPNYEMIDFVCINSEYCTYRSRTESLTEAYSSSGDTITDQRKKECLYLTSNYALGSMFDNILEHISYIGPTRQMLAHYLHPSSTCDGKYAAE